MTGWSVTTPIIARELAAVHGGVRFRISGSGIWITGNESQVSVYDDLKGPDLGPRWKVVIYCGAKA
jgi:hypothetical protein